ncbi:MAG: amino acid adenylation domain-containing protein [Bacteriovoracaceae bacterium]|jgi:amino acid adenylation domain-containing protein
MTRFVHHLLNKAYMLKGHNTAISFGNESLSYLELNNLSNQKANFLLSQGACTGDVIGICFNRSIESIVTMIAILKTGASYLPLDPEYPVDRLNYMVSKSDAKMVICHKELSSIFDESRKTIHFSWDVIRAEKSDLPKIDESKIKSAYIIFTSGSTGLPKGVDMGHQSLVNLIQWQNNQTELGESSKTLQFTPLSFDVHFQEIFSTLSLGGELVLVSEEQRLDTLNLLKLLSEKRINRLFLPFVALNHLCELESKYEIFPEYLKEVTTAGEQLKITEQIRSFFLKTKASLYNHYGPSETHVITSYKLATEVNTWEVLPPIGKEITNSKVLILNSEMKEVENGEIGELFLAGNCLANGYIHDKEKTLEKFITSAQYGKLYRSGDIGKRLPDGNIEYLGRNDDQVKIRGYRIEIGEIEIALQGVHPEGQVAVKIIEEDDSKYICAYLTAEFKLEKLRKALKANLPDYMVPSHFCHIAELPLTPSGKLDRQALPLPTQERPELAIEYKKPDSETETLITRLWSKQLKIECVGVQDSFFDLGGTSLMALNILAELQEVHNKDISITHLFQYPTIESIAKYIDYGSDSNKKEKSYHKKGSAQFHDVAIIAMNGRFPGANNLDELWEIIVNQKNNVNIFKPSELNPTISKEILKNSDFVRASGHLTGYDTFDCAYFGITPREAQLMDPQQRKLLELSLETLELAGYSSNKFDGDIGIFAGSANNSYQKIVYQYPEYINQVGEFNVMLGNEKDYISTRVAHKLNLTGPALSIHTGCSTSLVAIIQAVKSLRDLECDMALAGGISVSGLTNIGHTFQEGGILSKDGVCRPYDSTSTGTIFTDGAGLVLLKRLEDAIKDGDTIQAVIKGVGLNNDGANKMSFTAPSIEGQSDAILRAHADANISASDLDYIEGHGTATPVGDPIEVEALKIALGKSSENEGKCYLGSLKSNLGHLTAAAGVAGLIKAVLVVEKGIVPATANLKKLNPSIQLKDSPLEINMENIVLSNPVRTAGISSFGVGGTNAHIIIQNYKNIESIGSEKQAHLVKLSSKTQEGLCALTEKFLNELVYVDKNKFENISFTLDKGRNDFSYRRSIILSKDNILKLSPLNSAQNKVNTKLSVGFMFPGQGSQYINMGRELMKSSRVFQEAVEKCCDLIRPYLDQDIRDIMFCDFKSDLETKEKALKNTYYTQPAIFIIEYSLGVYLMSLGLSPKVFVGHSIGEFSAAALAGVFSLEDGLKMIAKRGELMRSLPTGSMMSVALESGNIKSYLNEKVQIAAINNSQSTVIAGDFDSIQAIKEKLELDGISAKILHTSHAFHSNMMLPIVEVYKEFLKGIKFNIPKIKMYSTVTSKVEDDLYCSPTYWANHLKEPVLFSPTIINILENEDLVLCEVGPRTTLKSLTKKTALGLKRKDYPIISLMGSCPETENTQLLNALGMFWTLGFEINTDEFYSKSARRVATATTVFKNKKIWLEPKNIQITENVNEVNIINNLTKTGKNMNETKKELTMAKLSEIFEEASGIDVTEFSNDTSFLEMGMDSLFLTQVALNLKSELKIEITFRQLLEEYSSISLLADSMVDSIDNSIIGMREMPAELDPFTPAAATTPLKETTAHIPAQQALPAAIISAAQTPISTPVASQQPQVVHQQQIQARPVRSQMNPIIAGSGVENIIQKQLELMGQQIQLLNGQDIQVTSVQTCNDSSPELIVQPTVTSPINNEVTNPETFAPSGKISTQDEANEPEFKIAADLDNAKKAFGACARISTKRETVETSEKRNFINSFFNKYITQTQGSKNFTQNHRKQHADPRAVTGFKPESKEIVYPIVVEKSQDQYLWDIDGNRYVDMTCGFGSNFFGNGNKIIKELVKKQLEEGIEIGPQHPLTADVSALVCELTNSDRAAFCNTGSEAVLGAMRVARTVTGREKIIVFNGSYHGISDEVIIRGSKKGKSFPAAPGITKGAVSNMIVLDYGTQESLDIIREMGTEIAAVLVEPVQSRRADFHPKEFLQEVRRITTENESCLIFDEVITGFRIHPGGAQAYFDVKADLATYGKIVGGGMPIGVIAGKSEFMDALDGGHWQFGDESTPTVGVTYFAGTFVRHPLALAAAKGALGIIKDGGEKQLSDLNAMTQEFVDNINLFCAQVGAPIKLDNFGSLMKPKWEKDYAYSDVFFAQLRYNGIHVYDGFPWFVNLAHRVEDLDFVIKGFKKSIAFMQLGGLMDGTPAHIEKEGVFDSENAPVAGARLGRNELGSPAWFIENPDVAGEYIEI